jgi:hypothetical protein
VDGVGDLLLEGFFLESFLLEVSLLDVSFLQAYNPSFFIYSSTLSGTSLPTGRLARTAARISVAEIF